MLHRPTARGGRGRGTAVGLALVVGTGALTLALPGAASAVLPPGAPAGATAPDSDGGYSQAAWFGSGGPWDPSLGRETGTGGENELHNCQMFVNSPGGDSIATTPPAWGADVYNRCAGLGIKNDDPSYSPLRTASGNARWQGQYGVLTLDTEGNGRVALGYCSQDNLSHPGAFYADDSNKLIGDAALSAEGFSTNPTLKYVMWKYGNTYNNIDAAAVWNLNHMYQGSGSGLGITLGNFPNLSNDAALNSRIEAMNAEGYAKQGPWTLTAEISATGDAVTVRLSGPGGGIPDENVAVAVTGASGAPASVTTGADGTATFAITPDAGPVNVEVSATSEGPGDYYIIRATNIDEQTIASPGPGVPLAASDIYYVAGTPVIGTQAKDVADGDNIVVAGGQLIDTVNYSGLTPGDEYTLDLTWMDVTSGTPVATSLTATVTFTPTAESGSIDVGPVTVPASLIGRTLVAYERLHTGPDTSTPVIANHEDPTAVSQTVTVAVPTIGTVARDGADGDNVVQVGGAVIDQISYTGLNGGDTYTATLVWMVIKADGTVSDIGMSTTQSFVAEEGGTGVVDIGPVTVLAAASGKSIVAFEEVRDQDGNLIGEHKDPTAVSQIVKVTRSGGGGPVTGSDSAPMLFIAGGMIVAGGAGILLAKRRRQA